MAGTSATKRPSPRCFPLKQTSSWLVLARQNIAKSDGFSLVKRVPRSSPYLVFGAEHLHSYDRGASSTRPTGVATSPAPRS